MVDWRGFGTEQWRGTGAPVVETTPPTDATPSPPEVPAVTTADEGSESASAVEEEATDTSSQVLFTETEVGFLSERIVQLERSIDRMEQLVGRAQELQLAEQRAHEDTRRQLSEAQERVVLLLEAPHHEAPAPSDMPPVTGAESVEPIETSSAEAVTRDMRRGIVKLARWLQG